MFDNSRLLKSLFLDWCYQPRDPHTSPLWKKKYSKRTDINDARHDIVVMKTSFNGEASRKISYTRPDANILFKDMTIEVEVGSVPTVESLRERMTIDVGKWDFTFHNHKRKAPYVSMKPKDSNAFVGVARIPVRFVRPIDELPDTLSGMSEIEGKTILGIFFADADGDPMEDSCYADQMALVFSDGTYMLFFHHRDCCESVSIADITGDLEDLIGSPLLKAETASNYARCSGGDEQWTFYRFQTAKGELVVRWFGESNGYYGIEVYQRSGKLSTLKEAIDKKYVSDIHRQLFGPECEYLVDEAAVEKARLESLEQQLQVRVDKGKRCIETKASQIVGIGYVLDVEGIWWVMDELCISSTETQSAEWFKDLFEAEALLGDEFSITEQQFNEFNTVKLAAFLVKKGLK